MPPQEGVPFRQQHPRVDAVLDEPPDGLAIRWHDVLVVSMHNAIALGPAEVVLACAQIRSAIAQLFLATMFCLLFAFVCHQHRDCFSIASRPSKYSWHYYLPISKFHIPIPAHYSAFLWAAIPRMVHPGQNAVALSARCSAYGESMGGCGY